MKRLLSTALLLLSFQVKAINKEQQDTISNWQVYYRKAMILQSNAIMSTQRVVMTKGKVSVDSIYVYYADDTPCADCNFSFILTDPKGKKLRIIEGEGVLKKMAIKSCDLQVMEFNYHTNVILFYFKEDKNSLPVLLFEFQIK